MKQPPLLKKGDIVALVATARKHTENLLEPAQILLESWGLRVRLGATVGLEYHQLAGTDAERAQDFQNQCDDPEVKAIWCVRGGYGTVRMLDYVDFSKLKIHPKWIIGYSDITVFHAHLLSLGLQSIHGFMAFDATKVTEEAKKSLQLALFEKKLKYEIPTHHLNRQGNSEGIIIGGNVSVLYSLLGSVSAPDFQDKILFLEDLDEYLYHMDRMLMNLKRCGIFNKIKGLVVGGMTQMHDSTIPWGKNIQEIIYEHVSDFNFPVAFEFPAGHILDNRAIIMGATVQLSVTESTTKLFFT